MNSKMRMKNSRNWKDFDVQDRLQWANCDLIELSETVVKEKKKKKTWGRRIWNECVDYWTCLGTRIGQASECFVYWKDPVTNDTWGLNLTSPADARSFRECCVSLPRPTISLLFLSSWCPCCFCQCRCWAFFSHVTWFPS